MNKLEMLSLEQVAVHTNTASLEGVPVKRSLASSLIEQGFVERASTPDYFHRLKRSEHLMAVKITSKGVKKAETLEIDQFEHTLKRSLELVDAAHVG